MDPPAVDHGIEFVVAIVTIDDEPDVEARATHVGRHDPIAVVLVGDASRARQTGDGAGAEQVEGGRARRRCHTSDVASHQQRRPVTVATQPIGEVDDVFFGVWREERTDDRGDAAPVLVELGRYLAREQHGATPEGEVGSTRDARCRARVVRASGS